MKRRVVLEVTATAALCLALGGVAIWASRSGGKPGSANGGFSEQDGPGLPQRPGEPTEDPYNLPPMPTNSPLHLVGPHRCYLPPGVSPVVSSQASNRGGTVFSDGTRSYYVTQGGNCVTFEAPASSQAGWISPALEERLDTTNDPIYPCAIPNDALEVSNEAAAQAGGRVFDNSSTRWYLTTDGRCVSVSGAAHPPDWIQPNLEASLNDPNRNSENWGTPYPTEAVATFAAHRTAIAAGTEGDDAALQSCSPYPRPSTHCLVKSTEGGGEQPARLASRSVHPQR
jgi:hypothetical protein